MIRTALAAATLLFAASPAVAQTQQEALEARHDRALAAGYKALMLCSAIAIAERNGASRSPESVAAWELTGVQAPLDAVIRDLPFTIRRGPEGEVAQVAVEWATDMAPRVAVNYGADTGCSALPIGAKVEGGEPSAATKPARPSTLLALAASQEVAPALVDAIGSAFEDRYGTGTRTTAVVVTHRGNIVEQYQSDFEENVPQRTWSVAKSIAATLVGAAVKAGDASVEDPVGLNYWRGGGGIDPRNAITIDHALRMASGRYSDTPGNRTDPLYYGGSSVDETATAWPILHPPGTVFRYANNDTLIAVKAIEQWLEFYPPANFFAKLGMTHTVAETDWKGNYILSSQVWTTARDLAKLGQLYLNDGKLPSGERVLPEGWVKYVSTPSGPQPPTGTFGYGAGFWLLNKEEGVPPDSFAAIGNRGQYVVIVPSRGVVIVRRGEDPAGAGFDIAAFTRDVLAALGGK